MDNDKFKELSEFAVRKKDRQIDNQCIALNKED